MAIDSLELKLVVCAPVIQVMAEASYQEAHGFQVINQTKHMSFLQRNHHYYPQSDLLIKVDTKYDRVLGSNCFTLAAGGN